MNPASSHSWAANRRSTSSSVASRTSQVASTTPPYQVGGRATLLRRGFAPCSTSPTSTWSRSSTAWRTPTTLQWLISPQQAASSQSAQPLCATPMKSRTWLARQKVHCACRKSANRRCITAKQQTIVRTLPCTELKCLVLAIRPLPQSTSISSFRPLLGNEGLLHYCKPLLRAMHALCIHYSFHPITTHEHPISWFGLHHIHVC
jgi:hypothetical protein